MSRVTQELLANARAREAEAVKVTDADVPAHYKKSPVVKKPAAKKRTKAKAKKRA